MEGHFLTEEIIQRFEQYLRSEEKSQNTVEKYLRDIQVFITHLDGTEVTKEAVISYKNKLISENYAVRSINSMLASINSLLSFLGWSECKVKSIKLQRQIYCPEEKELTKAEYMRLVNTAKQKGNERLNLILQTICGTGIRVSELQFITVEAVKNGEATVSLKGKTRSVSSSPNDFCSIWAKQRGISGHCKRREAIIRRSQIQVLSQPRQGRFLPYILYL